MSMVLAFVGFFGFIEFDEFIAWIRLRLTRRAVFRSLGVEGDIRFGGKVCKRDQGYSENDGPM